MSDIPDEIMQRARECVALYQENDDPQSGWADGLRENQQFAIDYFSTEISFIARAILEAIAAEREECAKVADRYSAGGCACKGYGCTCGNYDDAGSAGGASTAKLIAAAIRKRGQTT